MGATFVAALGDSGTACFIAHFPRLTNLRVNIRNCTRFRHVYVRLENMCKAAVRLHPEISYSLRDLSAHLQTGAYVRASLDVSI